MKAQHKRHKKGKETNLLSNWTPDVIQRQNNLDLKYYVIVIPLMAYRLLRYPEFFGSKFEF